MKTTELADISGQERSTPFLDRASSSGLIKSGYGILLVLLLVLVVGSYVAINLLGETIREKARATEQSLLISDFTEDLFEARIAALSYTFSNDPARIEEVTSNIEEMLTDDRLSASGESQDIVATLTADILPAVRAYKTAFENVVEQAEVMEELIAEWDLLESAMRQSLGAFRQAAADRGESDVAYAAASAMEKVLLGRYATTRFMLTGQTDALSDAQTHFADAMDQINTLETMFFSAPFATEFSELRGYLSAMTDLLPGLQSAQDTRNQITEDVLDAAGMRLQNELEHSAEMLADTLLSAGGSATELASSTTTLLAVFGALITVVATVIASLVSSKVNGRLRNLAETTDALVAGDLDTPISGVDRKDETGRLAQALVLFRDGNRDARARRVRVAEEQKDREHVVAALSQALASLSSGDLNTRMPEPFAEEYETLRHDFNTAAERLSDALKEIVSQTGDIQVGATSLSQAADELARRTEGQAAALEETGATIVQLSESVNDTASGADKANSFVISARQEAEFSQTVVADTVAAMNKIQTTSNEVSQIIGVIDDLAFQTNLLALNAGCLLYTSPSPRDRTRSRMPSSA